MEPTAVTAVVTTRNRLGMLRRTVGAILGQRDVEVRVVVVDEGSTDATGAFLASVEDPRVRVLRNDVPVGLPAARNQGIAVADTEWVAICDDDDVWSPTKLTAQLAAVAARPGARWAVTGTILVDDGGRVIGHRDLDDDTDVLPRLLVANVTPTVSGLLIGRSLVDEVGGFDPDLRASEDWDMEIRMAAASPMASARGPFVAYRVAAGSMSANAARMNESYQTVRERYADLAAEHGVGFDDAGYREYLAHQELKARRRVPAARAYAALALERRDPRDAARALAALAAPGWMDAKGDARAAERVPADWRTEFDRWWADVPVLQAGPA
jgi:glycosyltransferase involved in cell wall biosynthesis